MSFVRRFQKYVCVFYAFLLLLNACIEYNKMYHNFNLTKNKNKIK